MLAFVMGAVFGPLAYLTGVKMGVLTFGPSQPMAVAILAAVWGIAVPMIYLLSNRLQVERSIG